MGKKKFDKSKSVTFKLIWRSTDDPEEANKNLSERVFSLVEPPRSQADKIDTAARDRILAQFTKQDLGLEEPKKPKKKKTTMDVAHEQVKGREDLWITHLMRMRQKAEEEEAEREEEEERKKAEKAKKVSKYVVKKGKEVKPQKEKNEGENKEDDEDDWEDDDEEGEWEDADEDEVEYEIEEIEEDEEEVERRDAEKLKKEQEDCPPLVDPETAKKLEREEYLRKLAEEDIDLRAVEVSKDIKTKRFDEFGLPLESRYNYYQHIVDPDSGGNPDFAFVAKYDKPPQLTVDIDLKKEEMTPEEREVFEALEYEGEDGAYEELEDNFVEMLIEGKEVVFEKKEDKFKDLKTDLPIKPSNKSKELPLADDVQPKDNKKVTFGENKVIEMESSKPKNDSKKKKEANIEPPKPKAKEVMPDPIPKNKPTGKDSILSKKDFQKVLDQHIAMLKEKHRDEREANRKKYNMPDSDEEEEIEEVSDDEPFVETVERLKYEEDIAMKQLMERLEQEAENSEEEELSDMETEVTVDDKISTKIVPTNTPKLNVVKEEVAKKKKNKKSEEGKSQAEESKNDSDNDADVLRKEELFNKRHKDETPEERKQRKALIKQFKQERKEKKKKFKETFETKKKQQLKIVQSQRENLQGLSLYKLS